MLLSGALGSKFNVQLEGRLLRGGATSSHGIGLEFGIVNRPAFWQISILLLVQPTNTINSIFSADTHPL